jgi:myo-inositol-1(or 4)-monophosphatase
MDALAARAIALDTARQAADLLRGATADLRSVRTKGGHDTDWVTEWDERSEALIRAELRARAPGTRILGEEGGESDSGAGRWLVDPVDGTTNFAHGLPIYCVSIAYEEDGQRLAGVIVAPALGWEFVAARGQGATLGGAPLHVSKVSHLRQALLATGFPADRLTSPRNNYRAWEHFQNVSGAVRRLGSAALDLCGVAAGWFDGYWEIKLHPWDLAAGALIVEEAGGRVTGVAGEPFDVDRGEIVASNGRIHDHIVDELRGLT